MNVTKKDDLYRNIMTELTEERQMDVMRMIQRSLRGGADDVRVDSDWQISRAIETEIFEWAETHVKWSLRLSMGHSYMMKARTIAFNLGNVENRRLTASVLSGEISPKRLVAMTHHEMYPEIWEDIFIKRKETEEWLVAQKKRMSELQSGLFVCRKCRSGDTEYVQMQTRSADEPMTNFHWCNGCGNRWRT